MSAIAYFDVSTVLIAALTPQRSFCYVDDAVEGLMRVMQSDYAQPLNVGSDEMVRCPVIFLPELQ